MESSDNSDDDYAPISMAAWGDQQQSGENNNNGKEKVVDWHSLVDPSIKIKPGALGSGGLHRRGPNYKPVDEDFILQQRLGGNVPKQQKLKALREAEKKVEGGNGNKKSNKKSSSSSSSSSKKSTSIPSSSSASTQKYSKPLNKKNNNNTINKNNNTINKNNNTINKNNNTINKNNKSSPTMASSFTASAPPVLSTIRRPPPSVKNNSWSASSLVETPFWEQNMTTTTTTTNLLSASNSSISSSSSSSNDYQQQQLQSNNNNNSNNNNTSPSFSYHQQQSHSFNSTPPGFENNIKSNHIDDHIKRLPPGFEKQDVFSSNNEKNNNVKNGSLWGNSSNHDHGWDNSSWDSGFNNNNNNNNHNHASSWPDPMEQGQLKDQWGSKNTNNNNNNDSWLQKEDKAWVSNDHHHDSWVEGGGWGTSNTSSASPSPWDKSTSPSNYNSNNNNHPTRFSDPSKNKYSGTNLNSFPKNYYKKDGNSRPAFIETPTKVASPPTTYNPVVVSVHLELENNVKIPVNIHKLDDPTLLARQFSQSHNISSPKIIQAITKLFIQQKERAMQRYDQRG